MKKDCIVFVFIFCFSAITAQISNQALCFRNDGCVQFKTIEEINTSPGLTFQTWFNVDKWQKNSNLFIQQDGSEGYTAVRLGDRKTGTIEFVHHGHIFRFENPGMREQCWYQLTLVYHRQSQRKAVLYLNGEQISLSSEGIVEQKLIGTEGFFLGKSLDGRMDEIRLWTKNLSEENFYLWNTVNHYHPDYEFLLSYWKGDQQLESLVYDSRGNRHGKPSKVAYEVVTDNPAFKYRLLAGYTTFNSLFSRDIERETYLMTNDLIILSGKTTTEGEVSFGPSDESGVPDQVRYLADFAERKGVFGFDGEKSVLKLPATAFPVSPEFSFGAWIFIDKWEKNACLIRKMTDGIDQFSIRLGDNSSSNDFIVTLQGKSVVFPTEIQPGKWQYLSVSVSRNPVLQSARIICSLFDKNKKEVDAQVQVVSAGKQIQPVNETKNTIGEGFWGKMDEVSYWVSDRSKNVAEDAAGIPVARIGQATPQNYLDSCHAYWKFDNPQQPGLDSFSWTNLVQILRSAYDGYTGYRIRGSFSGGGEKNWESVVRDDAARKRFAREIAGLMQSPLLDGVDLDFEWCYDDTCWVNYSKTILEVKKAMPEGKVFTVTPHVVAYKLTEDAIQAIDFALFQNYGPSPERFKLSDFKNSLSLFRKQGYPKTKTVLSTSTTTSKGISASGSERRPNAYRTIVSAIPDLKEECESATVNGYTHWLNNVEQTRKRARFVVDKDLAGIMYWDMGCDVSPENHLSIVRAINTEISSNVVQELSSKNKEQDLSYSK
ncbi:MAG: glycosyl hydrolase family 18 protein [Paludibacter sp.]|nr:glycosyl hydrolase family 18 protein [Paludibacter sp.]